MIRVSQYLQNEIGLHDSCGHARYVAVLHLWNAFRKKAGQRFIVGALRRSAGLTVRRDRAAEASLPALYTDPGVGAEPGRAMLQHADREAASPRRLPFRAGSGAAPPRLPRDLQRASPAPGLDEAGRRDAPESRVGPAGTGRRFCITTIMLRTLHEQIS